MQRIQKHGKTAGECSPACHRARLRDQPSLLVALAGLSFAIVAGGVRAAEPAAEIRRLAQDFVTAFSDPDEPEVLREVFRKWEEPIVYTIHGQPNPEVDALLDGVAAELRAKAGIDIERLAEGKANVVYVFGASSYDFAKSHYPYIRYFYHSDDDAEMAAREIGRSDLT